MDINGRIEIKGFDWGPAVTGVILKYEGTNPDKASFKVTEEKKNKKDTLTFERIITDAYYSDESGNRTDKKSGFISLELRYGPEEGSPMYFDHTTGYNNWFDYLLKISVEGKAEILLNNDQFYFPETEGVNLSDKFTGSEGYTFSYASYTPKNASETNKRPLVIWIHGMGEGGDDPLIVLYGNKVVSLFGEEFQNIMDGAYVLAPQTPTLWLQYKKEDTASWLKNRGEDSIYLKDLMELIDKFAGENYVDKKRIIVGGCSNGGFMTMDLILNYPDYFAAAYPICEAFYPKKLKKDNLLPIKNMPMWFVYAKNDITVPPAKYEKPLLKMLDKIEADNVIVSEFEDVHDTSGQFVKDGKPVQYFGHFSWIYFFNNDCIENGVSIWKWMSERTK